MLRDLNPCGSHPNGLIGEDPIEILNNLFPYISQVAIRRINLLKVFGDNWDTEDGSGVRDYIHIVDLSEGYIDAIVFLISKESIYKVINLGSGKGYSVFQMILEFELSTGCEIPFVVEGRRDGDVAISYADISKAKDLLGWSPKRSLKQICIDGWNWQRNNPQGFT